MEESIEKELRSKEKQLQNERLYYLSLYQSYEGKLSRVEPLSDEFEETFKGLSEVKEKLWQITMELVKIRMQQEYK